MRRTSDVAAHPSQFLGICPQDGYFLRERPRHEVRQQCAIHTNDRVSIPCRFGMVTVQRIPMRLPAAKRGRGLLAGSKRHPVRPVDPHRWQTVSKRVIVRTRCVAIEEAGRSPHPFQEQILLGQPREDAELPFPTPRSDAGPCCRSAGRYTRPPAPHAISVPLWQRKRGHRETAITGRRSNLVARAH
jgi:hypothetical protein